MAEPYVAPELPAEQPPMLLEQHKSGLWMYSRPAWVGGPAIEPNGVPPGITLEDDAKRAVNQIYPGAFPEVEPPPLVPPVPPVEEPL